MTSPRWLPPLLRAAFILILTSTPGSALPASPFRNADKVVHLVIYGALGGLIVRSWADGSHAATTAVLALVVISCFGAIDEWHQQYIPQRSMDLLDWAADTVGAAVGVLVSVACQRVRMIA